jgi:RHS repeat-associated protein
VLDLYNAKARMYDAAARRFMAVDPVKGTIVNPQSLAQYTYCLNNPLKYVDLIGLKTEIIVYSGEGNALYGHVEIAIDGIIYSYGRYGNSDGVETWGSINQYGNGILVKTEANYYLWERNQKSAFSVYEMNFSTKAEKRIVSYFETLICEALKANPGEAVYSDRSTDLYFKILYKLTTPYDVYNILGPNCVTVMMDAIQYGFFENDAIWIGSHVDAALNLSAVYPPAVEIRLNTSYNSEVSLIKEMQRYGRGEYPTPSLPYRPQVIYN